MVFSRKNPSAVEKLLEGWLIVKYFCIYDFGHFISLNFDFLICKVKIIIPTFQGCED